MRFADSLPKRVGKFNAVYPWYEIAESGKVGVLVSGEDFNGDTQNPTRAAYQWGKAHGYRVRTRVAANGDVYVQFIGK